MVSVLDSLASTLRPGIEMAVACAAAVALRNSRAALTKRGVASRSLLPATGLALVSGSLGVYLAEASVLDREYVEGVAELLSVIGSLFLLSPILLGKRHLELVGPLASLGLFAVLTPSALRLSRAALAILKADAVNSDVLLAISGMAIAASAVVAYGAFLIRASRAPQGAIPLIAATAMVLILSAQRLVGTARFGFSYGYLPLTPELLSIAAPLINGYDHFTYAVLAASAVFAVVRLARAIESDASRPSPAANPAELRKERATRRAAARSAAAILIAALAMTASLYAETYAKQLKKKAAELSPAEPVKAEGRYVSIPVAKVKTPGLHRFEYRASNGAEVRFIVIHKGSGVYGVGLDYCDICGPTGYYQRGSDVVCKRCDVIISIATIGIPGGCNPIPLKHAVSEDRLRISAADLESVKNKFR